MREVVVTVVDAIGADASRIDFSLVPDGPEDVPDLAASPARARDLLGWEYSIPLAEGLGRMARYRPCESACA